MALTSVLTLAFSATTAAVVAAPVLGVEKQLTHGPGGRILTNVNVWSPDGKWIVYDTRSDVDGSVFDGTRIEMVNADTGQIRRLYESHHGADCGVATFNPKRAQVAFILGPENPTPDWQYGSAHRQGVLVDVSHPDKATNLDARDITPPLTPGALRGGSHVHVFSPDGQWASFTYNDALLSQFTTQSVDHDIDQRNVGVSVPGHKVTVSKDNPRNHDGTYFTVLATRTTDHPRPGSDDILQALEEGWIGTQGYVRPDGTRQRRALAYQGQVTGVDGKPFWEVFVADLPDDVTKPSPNGPLQGTMTRRPAPPFGTHQRRLTQTAGRKYPGIQGPRHWLRSSPDGAQIAFLMRDDNGIAQLWSISPNGGEPRQITHDAWGVASAFTWSPDGQWIAYAADNSVFIVEAATGKSHRLTARTDDADAPSALACVFSPDGRRIAYQRRLADKPGPNAPRSNQIFIVLLEGAASSPAMVTIPAGQFVCGSPTGYWDEKPAHDVAITQAFSIASSPVSNAEFERFDPAHHQYRDHAGTASGDDAPVRFVTWEEANAYCRWLSVREGKQYRLPTEAEWEYAFRTAPGALYAGREVENWCADWYGPYPSNLQRNPIGYATGSVRAVRGGTWRAPKSPADTPNIAARLGGLPNDRNSAIGLRVVLGPPPTGTALTQRPTPLWAKDVSQKKWDWKPTQDMAKPYFAEPVSYVKIPAGSQGPLFSGHNHDPGLVACPNGDLLAIWYSTNDEMGRELTVAASRLRRGHTDWDAADLFWDVPGRNDHAPALWADANGALFHFNGLAAEGGWQNLALIMQTSRDNGVTWTPARFLDVERTHGNMPIPSPFQASDGASYLPCDATPEGSGGSVLHVSHDRGATWAEINKDGPPPVFAAGKTGAWIAGIHTGVTQWTDGSFVAVGRSNEINGHMAMSVSHDSGHSWTYSATPFPGIGGGHRPVLRRLKEGVLLLISFTPGSEFTDTQGRTFTGKGMFAAVSNDGGKTWPIRKLLADGKTRTLDGQGWTHQFTMDADHAEPAGYLTALQTPDGMIHLISSGVYYHFNLAWLKQPNTREAKL